MWSNGEAWTSKDVLKLLTLLRDEQDKLASLLDALSVGVVVLTPQLELASANAKALQMLDAGAIENIRTAPETREAALTGSAADTLRVPGLPGSLKITVTGTGHNSPVVLTVIETDAGPVPAQPDQLVAYEAPAAMFAHNAEGQVTFANKHLERLTGFAQRELLGMTVRELLPQTRVLSSRLEQDLQPAVRMLQTRRARVPVRVKEAIASSEEQPGHIITVVHEVEKGDPVAPNAAVMTSLERVSGEIAHRLNNLLTAVLTYSDLIATRFGSVETLREDARRISEAGTAAAGLTAKLLTFSRGRPVETAPLLVDGALKDMRPLLEGALGNRHSLRMRLGRPAARVLSSMNEFESLIMPFLENAREAFGSVPGEVVISTSEITPDAGPGSDLFHALSLRPVSHVCIHIRDNGPGVDPHIVERVFEPFSTTKEGSDGLGLSVVYGIARRLGGVVALDTGGIGGASFRICLPELQAE